MFSTTSSSDIITIIAVAYARAHTWLLGLCGTITQNHKWARAETGQGELVALVGPGDVKLTLPCSATAFFDVKTATQWQAVFGAPAFAQLRVTCGAVADVISLLQCLCQGLLLVGGENMPPWAWIDTHAVELWRVVGMAPSGAIKLIN